MPQYNVCMIKWATCENGVIWFDHVIFERPDKERTKLNHITTHVTETIV